METVKKYPRAFAIKHKNIDIRMKSRSGGAFIAISDCVLENDGVVYGCALDANFMAVHRRATSKEERDAFQGSKYVQSDKGKVFIDVKKDLMEGRTVLFSGTPCEIDGLKGFLGNKDYENLILVDIICHGVPSPKVWKEYIEWVEKLKRKKVMSADFRNKKYGWNDHIETLYFKDGEWNGRIFTNLFYSHYIIRPSCFECPYRKLEHPSDITLADFWGIDQVDKKFNDNKGVSYVLVNTQKGEEYFIRSADKTEYFECDVMDCAQPTAFENYEEPEGKEIFWEEYHKKPFQAIAKKYGGWEGRINLKGRIKKMIPKKMRKIVKQLLLHDNVKGNAK